LQAFFLIEMSMRIIALGFVIAIGLVVIGCIALALWLLRRK
jgi:hypothetical protein